MSDIKLSVTITLPGSVMMSSQECEKNPKENYDRNFITLSVKRIDPKTKKEFFRNEPLEYKTRKCKTAQQVIKMCDEAYEYMTSPVCPEWFNSSYGGPSRWKKLMKEDRLEYHLDRLCKSFGGTSYTYAVYTD